MIHERKHYAELVSALGYVEFAKDSRGRWKIMVRSRDGRYLYGASDKDLAQAAHIVARHCLAYPNNLSCEVVKSVLMEYELGVKEQ